MGKDNDTHFSPNRADSFRVAPWKLAGGWSKRPFKAAATNGRASMRSRLVIRLLCLANDTDTRLPVICKYVWLQYLPHTYHETAPKIVCPIAPADTIKESVIPIPAIHSWTTHP